MCGAPPILNGQDDAVNVANRVVSGIEQVALSTSRDAFTSVREAVSAPIPTPQHTSPAPQPRWNAQRPLTDDRLECMH